MIMTQLRTLKGGELIPSTTSSSSTTARKVESHSDRFTRRCSNFSIFQKTFFDIISPRRHCCLLRVKLFPFFLIWILHSAEKSCSSRAFLPALVSELFYTLSLCVEHIRQIPIYHTKGKREKICLSSDNDDITTLHTEYVALTCYYFSWTAFHQTHTKYIASFLGFSTLKNFTSRFRFPPSHATPRNLRISSYTHSNLICFNFSTTNNNKHTHRMAVDSHLVEATQELLSLNPREQHEKWNILTNLFELEQVDERVLGDVEIVTPN